MTNKLIFLVAFLLVSVPAFAQSVNTDWVKRYNGPGNNTDVAFDLATDDLGNVYVTGVSWDEATMLDYTTIKYDSAGNQLWVSRYNGSGNHFDWASALAVDDAGNVHVTGKSSGNGTSYDYLTIKYDPDGNELWVRRYNESGESYDVASAMALDGQGNVYVTGESSSPEAPDYYLTIKYDSTGSQVWVRKYNGTGDGEDGATAMAVDGTGNIHVTGKSQGTGTGYDFATIKYDSDGNEIWVRRYNGSGNGSDMPTAMAVDDSGNVCVTGCTDGTWAFSAYVTVKYDSDGNLLWAQKYSGSGDSTDVANDLAIDRWGNVYVTGYSYGLGTHADYATIKYDPDGNQLWVRRYNDPENHRDAANALTVDESGNVYVAGRSGSSTTNYDYVTIKYDTDGDQLWFRRYNGPGNHWDEPSKIMLDWSGNVLVTGVSEGSGTGSDFTTVKYVQFYRGNVDDDGEITLADAVYLINYLFSGGSPPVPELWLADVNCNDSADLADAVYLINYLFRDGPPPCQ